MKKQYILQFLFIMTLFSTTEIRANGCIDASVRIHFHTLFFQGGEVSVYDEEGPFGARWSEPQAISEFFSGVNFEYVDAAYYISRLDKLYLISGDMVVSVAVHEYSFDESSFEAIPGTLVPLSSHFHHLPDSWEPRIDAAFYLKQPQYYSVFLFQDNKRAVLGLSIVTGVSSLILDDGPGGITDIFTNHYPEGIDAITWRGSEIYAIKGSSYVPITITETDFWGINVSVSPQRHHLNYFYWFNDWQGDEDELVSMPATGWSCFTPIDNDASCPLNYQLPDNSCNSSSTVEISISDAPGTALGEDVRLDYVVLAIDHPHVGDLEVSLISPAGVEVSLADQIGGNGNNFGSGCSFNTYFSMEATTPIQNVSPPFASAFLPMGDFADFYDGSDPNGNWKLKMCDMAGDNAGVLNRIELVFDELTALEDVHTNGLGLALSPNPSTGQFHLELEQLNAAPIDLRVINTTGQELLRRHYEPYQSYFSDDLDLSQQAPGVYFVQVTVDSKTATERIVIQ